MAKATDLERKHATEPIELSCQPAAREAWVGNGAPVASLVASLQAATRIIPVAISLDLILPAFMTQFGIRITPRAEVSIYANWYHPW